ncbi:MAG: TSUP family transporter [Gammaproteobacteria bacterium]|nr:TSUP family transporter [Gammaproteobacteria bacterium]
MEFFSISLEILILLFSVAIIAGFVDTLAGGGGLISLPALILSGIPPLAALGTNKLQGSMGTATATLMMFKKEKVSFEDVKFLMLFAFIGSASGSVAVQFMDTDLLNFIVPSILFIIAIYFLVAPHADENDKKPKISSRNYNMMVVPSIGWYDGMFGPGTGSFFALAGVALRGHGLINSTAIAKTLNFSTNFASLLIFLVAGQVVWVVGLLMMAGQAIGAWIGSHFLFKINPRILRYIVVFMCLGMLFKYNLEMGWVNF